MRDLLIKLWMSVVVICSASGLCARETVAAQKPTDRFWYETVEVKRVVKPNRRITRRLPRVQKLPLLALQLRVLKHLGGEKKQEVDSQSVFATGDQLKVGITPNQSGYLYFILTNAGGGVLRNDRVFVTRNTEHVCPTICPGLQKPGTGCYFEFKAPAPASGVEEIVIIFSRNMITNLPNTRRERETSIGRDVLEEIKSRSGQILEQVPGKIERLLRGAPGRFAILAQNTNREDNEELVVTLKLKHRE